MKEVKIKDIIKNKELAEVIDYWNDQYGYRMLIKDNKLYLLDLQTVEYTRVIPITIRYLIDYYIEQLTNKREYHNITTFDRDIKILENHKLKYSEED